jgi:hypothetical protein
MIVYMQVGTRGTVHLVGVPQDAEGGAVAFVERFRREFAALYRGLHLRVLAHEPGGNQQLLELRDRFSRYEERSGEGGTFRFDGAFREHVLQAARVYGGSEIEFRNPYGDDHKTGPKPQGRWIVQLREKVKVQQRIQQSDGLTRRAR